MATLSEKRTNLVQSLGGLLKLMNEGRSVDAVAQMVYGELQNAERLVRGPENCEWKNTVAGLREYAAAYLSRKSSENETEFRWALLQYLVWLGYALDNPARVPQPTRTLDPNSETYRCM